MPRAWNPVKAVCDSIESALRVVPDSDDEDIVMEGEDDILQKFAKKRRQETNMQRWIKQLAILFKEEQRKVCVAICLTLARARDVHSTFCIMSLGKLRAARDLRVLSSRFAVQRKETPHTRVVAARDEGEGV